MGLQERGAAGFEKRKTLAIYSRFVYGRSDFGVNEGRITDWLARLSAQP